MKIQVLGDPSVVCGVVANSGDHGVLQLTVTTRERWACWEVSGFGTGLVAPLMDKLPTPEHCKVSIYQADADVETLAAADILLVAESSDDALLLSGVRYSIQEKDQIGLLFMPTTLLRERKELAMWRPSF